VKRAHRSDDFVALIDGFVEDKGFIDAMTLLLSSLFRRNLQTLLLVSFILILVLASPDTPYCPLEFSKRPIPKTAPGHFRHAIPTIRPFSFHHVQTHHRHLLLRLHLWLPHNHLPRGQLSPPLPSRD